uniref:Glutamine--fructose-6-phosphate aminotransferase [isomerizing] n=1 Tax=candidate division WOR-3 bacterium TaxID=2052148 RepID=A0A7V3ZTU4_UNCW3
MCGIVGYIGSRDIISVLLVALERLEYRGYDSCGIAVKKEDGIFVKKTAGRLHKLKEILNSSPLFLEKEGETLIGIGHTRWATHGKVSDENAHPFLDCEKNLAIVHNGIIENFQELKNRLLKNGHQFESETDTEVIVHLLEEKIKEKKERLEEKEFLKILLELLKELKGSFALALISKKFDFLIGIKKGSPLLCGVGKKEGMIASDILALVGICKKVYALEDGEIVFLKKDEVIFYNEEGKAIEKESVKLDLKIKEVSKGRYRHFMRKEIFEQPKILKENCEKRLFDNEILLGEGFHFYPDDIKNISNIVIQACGTSYHAGLIGRDYFERIVEIPTTVEIASELLSRPFLFNNNALMIAISQSGETADTLMALREAKARKIKNLAILNVKRSSMDREAENVVFINAGPEIGVASTKAYTAQIFSLFILALYFAKIKGKLDDEKINNYLENIRKIPEKVKKALLLDRLIKKVAKKYYNASHFVFLGRGINYPSALEGALKLKEISYIHAAGYPAGEMKHGPISVISEETPVICICVKDSTYEKMIANIMEAKARGGKIIAIGYENDERLKEIADELFSIPETIEFLTPIVVAIPLQLFAYHIAVLRGCDVDKPRHLAKSVTVL